MRSPKAAATVVPARVPPAVRAGTGWRRWASAAATVFVILLVVAVLLPRRPVEAPPPTPGRAFDDTAGLVSTGFAAGKGAYLAIQRRAQVAVAIRPDAPDDVEAYANRAANAWRVGVDRRDNGIVVLVLPALHTVRVEIGYGLEGLLPDVDVARLVDATILPAFSAHRYEDGIDAFLDALSARLDAGGSEAPLVATNVGLFEFFAAVMRQVPRWARQAAGTFLAADVEGRIVLALFGAVFVAVFGRLAVGILIGVAALAQLPWRIAHGTAWRAIDRARLAAEFAPAEFVRRPPPSIVAALRELAVPQLAYGLLCALGVVIAVAFLAVGSDVLVGARGQFGGAGVTRHWTP